jgi:8-oxo-dGTP diphosphatase/2-hydroxy-dATP diphosphatase
MKNKSKKIIDLTLVMVCRNSEILLGMKKRGFGKGKWNGFGGKVELEENIENSAKRELLEEASIGAKKIDKRGFIEFEFKDDYEILAVHIFKVDDFSGEPKESEEMIPRWFDVEKIPFSEMWSDDFYWLPLLLKNKKFKGRFVFSKKENILEKELREVDKI